MCAEVRTARDRILTGRCGAAPPPPPHRRPAAPALWASQVRAVQHRPTRRMFAMKYVSKRRCVTANAGINILQERDVLSMIRHPFVANLQFAFQDAHHLFLCAQQRGTGTRGPTCRR